MNQDEHEILSAPYEILGSPNPVWEEIASLRI